MIKTLNDLEIARLKREISSVLDEYFSATRKPMFEVEGVPRQNAEKIWNEINQTN